MLARRTQFHQNILVSHVTEGNPNYREMFEGAQQMLISQGADIAEAAIKAKAMIYGMVRQQAAMLSFIDNFWLLGIIFIVLIPLVFVMRKTTPQKENVTV